MLVGLLRAKQRVNTFVLWNAVFTPLTSLLCSDISNFTISKDPYKTLYQVDFAFICSGTATLEAALIGTPFVLNYIANSIDYWSGSSFRDRINYSEIDCA